MIYNPSNWYWIVAGSTTQVYSSARAELVPVADATYEAWLAAGNVPTKIDTQNNLLAALFQQNVSGINIVSAGTPSLNGTYSTSPDTLELIEGTCLYILMNSKFPGGGSTMDWSDMTGIVHTFPNTTSFQAFATAHADYVYGMRQYINGAAVNVPSNTVTII